MKPLSDFVFLEKEKQKETKKGIILSDVSKSKPSVFVVVAAGPGKIDRHGNLVETKVKKGDTRKEYQSFKREISLVYTELQVAKMWGGKCLEELGTPSRIELFARQKTEGWDVWGIEVKSDIKL